MCGINKNSCIKIKKLQTKFLKNILLVCNDKLNLSKVINTENLILAIGISPSL
jgi:hypothetical protein